MINMKFKSDDYISLPVANGLKSGDPFVVGTLVGVLTTDEGGGVGNKEGFASVALEGGAELNIPVAIRPAVLGETLYITSAGVVNRTASGNQRLGKVTHLGYTTDTAIVKIVQ